MMKNIRLQTQSPGSVLITSFFLSFFILTLGTALLQSIATESKFSADLLFSEKAYFTAESGIELGLLALKEEPTQSTDELPFTVGNYQGLLSLNTSQETFSVIIPPNQSVKMFLRKDTATKDLAYTPQPSFQTPFVITPRQQQYQWKVLCPQTLTNGTKRNASLQGISLSAENFIPLSATGTLDYFVSSRQTKTENSASLQTLLALAKNSEDAQNCFLSIKNLSSTTMTLSASGDQVTPPQSVIVSQGIAGNKEKVLQFEYTHKNLSSVFDFGVFHTEN